MLAAVLSLCSCGKKEDTASYDTIRAAVLVNDTGTYNAAYNQLKNSMLATLETSIVSAKNENNYAQYDVIFVDKSVAECEDFNSAAIEEYAQNGGCVFVENAVYRSFSLDFLGAQYFEKVEECPSVMQYPRCSEDIKKIQELIYDFSALYKEYKNYDVLSEMDYGYAMIPSTAKVIAADGAKAIYTLNNYGNGYVFFSNPLLPNDFSVNDLTTSNVGQYLSNTTVGANILMRSYFAEFASLKKYGYAVERTYGSFASKPAAWELHYEDITGIENESAIKFDELCRQYGQFPSFTLARNPYTWFERAESVTYALSDNGQFAMDPYENAYSSGTHFVSAGEWLKLDNYEKTDSYFKENEEYIKRAYPYPVDFNEDGTMDLICGSADGYIYLFPGNGMKHNYELGVATYFTNANGEPLNVGEYSSPVLADINGDGKDELITGSGDGNIYAFEQVSGMAFEAMGSIIETGIADPMPYPYDLDGDGRCDMLVGSRENGLRVYYGADNNGSIAYGGYEEIDTSLDWCAPCAYDLDNDGEPEIYMGTSMGYIVRFVKRGNEFGYDGYIEGNENNFLGNTHLRFGENCVPRFYDIDNDGNTDVIAGQLEYGMAYPMDSPYFPCKEKLKEQIDYCKKNNIYIGAHVMTHVNADDFHEEREIELQKNAFADYGIEWKDIGVNQHTWYTSGVGYDAHYDNVEGYDGTYRNEFESGLLWNNGSQTPGSIAVPQVSAENSINVPFYLFAKGAYGMLMLQPSNTPHGSGVYSYTSAKYGVPMLFYDHCDYIYSDEDDQKTQIEKVDKFVKDFGYSFVSEKQMAKAVAASYNTRVLAKKENGKITLKPQTIDEKIPLYDKNYSSCVGVKVVFSEEENIKKYSASASVWRIEDNGIYVSLDSDAYVTDKGLTEPIQVCSVNSPATIKKTANNVKVTFKEGGIMQVFVEGDAKTNSDGWQVTKDSGRTIFTKYGDADSLKIMK